MRLLNKNKRDIWYSYFIGQEEVIVDGKFTGEFENKYTNPYLTKVNFMPISSFIKKDDFGTIENIDMVIVVDKDIFNEDTVFFINRPNNTNIEDNYDYKVYKIIKSINSYTIGLKKRV